MAVVQTGNELGTAILKALGIEAKMVLGISISMEPDQLATVTITRALESDEAGELVTALEQYDLVRKEDRLKLPVVALSSQLAPGIDHMAAVRAIASGEFFKRGRNR